MAGDTEDEIPDTGAVFTFGKSKFADNVASKFWLKNDIPFKLACGDEHTALITENGKLFMFGSNNWGQLGLGEKISVNKPTCVKALKSEKVKLVACGRNHTLVYTSCGNLYAAGGNNEGQLGLGDFKERTSFQLVEFFTKHGPIKMLAAGSNTSAAITQDGKMYVWGDNSEGQIGLGKEEGTFTPRQLYVGRRVTWVSCGYYHSAFVTEDGALFTFGERDGGKLGLSAAQAPNHKVPQQVESVCERVLQVACGGGHTLALTEKYLYSFGLGQFGQLGHGTFTFESQLPRVVEHFRKGRVKHIVCGENHSAVLTESGLLYTFGDGRHGKLALGEEYFANQFKPTLCPRFLKYNVQAVTCGGCHMLVLAKPRLKRSEDVILEDSDVTEDHLEKLLREAQTCHGLNRSLSARDRRRERERSPEQFKMMFRTLPPLSSGHLNVSLPAPSKTLPSQLNQKTTNGFQRNGLLSSAGKVTEEHEVDGKTPVENYEDNESVKDLGETVDLLNLTHVIKMDPGEKTITLSPVQKKRVKTQKKHSKAVKRCVQDPDSDNEWAGLSSSKAQPTKFPRSYSGKSQFGERQFFGIPYQSSQSEDSDKGKAKEHKFISHTVRKPRAKTDRLPKSELKPDSQGQLTEIKAEAKTQSVQEDFSESEERAHFRNVKVAKTETEKGVYKSEAKAKGFRQEDSDKAGSKTRSVDKKQRQASEKRRFPLSREVSAQLTQAKHIPAEPEIKKVKVKRKPRLVRTKLLDNTNEHDANTLDGRNSSEQYNQAQVATKATQSTEPEHKMDTQKKTKRLGQDLKAADRSLESIRSQSEDTLPVSLMGVTSLTEDLPIEGSVRLLKEVASSQFLFPTAFVNSLQTSGSPNTLISEDTEKNLSKRTAVTINVMPVPAASDEESERSMSQSNEQIKDKGEESGRDKTGQLSGTEKKEDESKERTDSKILAKENQMVSRVEYAEEESETTGQVTNDNGEEQEGTTSNEEHESERQVKEERSKPLQGKDSETEPEEEWSGHVTEEREEEVSETQSVEQEEEESRTSCGEEESRKESDGQIESQNSEPEEDEGEEESKSSKSESVSETEEDHSEGDESEEEEAAEEEKNSSEEEMRSFRKEKYETEDETESEEDTAEGGSEKEQESRTEEQDSEEEESEEGEESEREKNDSEEEEEASEAEVEEGGEEEGEAGTEKCMDENEESEAGVDESDEEESEAERDETEEEEGKEEEEEDSADREESEEEEEESEAGKEESEEQEESEAEMEESEEREESGDEEEESEKGKEGSGEEEEAHEEEEEIMEGETETEAEDSAGEVNESGNSEEGGGEEEDNNEAEKDIEESEQENEDEVSEAEDDSESEEEEEGGEQAGEHEDEEGEQEDKDEEENEEEEAGQKAEEEEEESNRKRKGRENPSFSSKQPKSKPNASKARKHRTISESQEPRQFWDDVLPQYLNLK